MDRTEDWGEGTWADPVEVTCAHDPTHLLMPKGHSGPGWADLGQRKGTCPTQGSPAVSRWSATWVGGGGGVVYAFRSAHSMSTSGGGRPMTRMVPHAWF